MCSWCIKASIKSYSCSGTCWCRDRIQGKIKHWENLKKQMIFSGEQRSTGHHCPAAPCRVWALRGNEAKDLSNGELTHHCKTDMLDSQVPRTPLLLPTQSSLSCCKGHTFKLHWFQKVEQFRIWVYLKPINSFTIHSQLRFDVCKRNS